MWGEGTQDGTWLTAPQGPSSSAPPVTGGPAMVPPGRGWNCRPKLGHWGTGECGALWVRPSSDPPLGLQVATRQRSGRGAAKAEEPWEQTGHPANPSGAPDEHGAREKMTLGRGLQAARFPGRGRKGIGNEGDSPAAEAQTWKA